MPNQTLKIPHRSDKERRILQEMRQRVNYWNRQVQDKLEEWSDAEDKALAFVPDTEVTKKRKAAIKGGMPDYTTIQVPYSYAVLLSAHTYITSVFLSRDPVFQFTGRHGESMQKTQAMEALISYQALVGQMLGPFYTWLYDALKYGFGVVGVYWEERYELISDFQEQPDPMSGANYTMSQPILMRTYAGNRLFNIQPQDFIWDAHYPVRDFQKGQFAGRRFKIGWNDVIRRKKAGYYTNVEFIPKDKASASFYSTEGSPNLDRPEVFDQTHSDWGPYGYEAGDPSHPIMVGGYELVMEIIPNEWGLGSSDWPQKYVMTATDDFSVLLGCQPQGAYHASFPYSVIPIEPEGYGITTRGIPETLEPIQRTLDWLVNSHFYNVRAALNNKYVVDPSKVVMKDVLDPLPGGVVRLKPSAYGQDVRLALQQMQVTDVTQNNLRDVEMMFGLGERTVGVNDQIMGMLNTGGRRTATEVRTSTSFGVNRMKTLAEFASTSGVEPLSRMLVQNTQQYYDMKLQFKIAGDLLQSAGSNYTMVTPDSIAGFYDFVPVDGTLPIDRFAQVNLWKELFQSILAIPEIGMQYDLGGIFSWVAQLAGIKNITQFKIQVGSDQWLQKQTQMGNSVPIGGGKPKMNGAGKPSDSKQGYQQPIQAAQRQLGA